MCTQVRSPLQRLSAFKHDVVMWLLSSNSATVRSLLHRLSAFKHGVIKRLRSSDSTTSTGTPALMLDTQKQQYAKAVFSNGVLPSNFSITIGVAPCNYSCHFCPQSVSKPRKAKWIDFALLRKCLEEMPEEGVDLNISSFSETIAAPVLVPSVRLMKQIRPKLKVVMASNGSLFRGKVVEELIDAGLDHYSFSFDAATPQAYRDLIQVDNFHKAWRNLEQIVEMRNRKKSPMKITTHIMHFKGVEKDFEKFKDYWEKKIDAVVLRPLGNWGGGGGLNLMQKMENMGYATAHQVPTERYPCASIFTHFIHEPDGHYVPCIGTASGYESDLRYSLGRVSETTWSQAWQRLQTMRLAHLRGRWDEIEACRNCNLWSLWQNPWTRSAPDANGESWFHLQGVPAVDVTDTRN